MFPSRVPLSRMDALFCSHDIYTIIELYESSVSSRPSHVEFNAHVP